MFDNESHKATFHIQNGPTFKGYSFGHNTNEIVSGEVVFTTSLVGYPESMSDPSYKGQIIVFTQPLIGNYGVPSSDEKDEYNLLKFMESTMLQCKAIIVNDYAWEYSHWTAKESLQEWCVRSNVPAVGGVDTREVVKFLREQGSTLGAIITDPSKQSLSNEELNSLNYYDPGLENLVSVVGTKKPYYIKSINNNNDKEVKTPDVLLVDCGSKENIVRCLVSRGANVTIVPFNYPIDKIAKFYDGIFVSNGPGDPRHCKETIKNLETILNDKTLQEMPIFGICLGHQLLCIAAGCTTEKMKYGNRAHNIPTLDLITSQCIITSQNHGYVVSTESLVNNKQGFKEYFVNLNDNTNEGMIHETRPIFSTQFHPEAKGGPRDTSYLFDNYFNNIAKYNKKEVCESLPEDLVPESLPTDRVL